MGKAACMGLKESKKRGSIKDGSMIEQFLVIDPTIY